jgi:phasin family protein
MNTDTKSKSKTKSPKTEKSPKAEKPTKTAKATKAPTKTTKTSAKATKTEKTTETRTATKPPNKKSDQPKKAQQPKKVEQPKEPVSGKAEVPAPDKQPVTPLERMRMIAEAAYYRAQERGLVSGNPLEDWMEAERAIDAQYTVDLSRVMTIFDPTEMLAQLTKAFTNVQVPEVNIETVLQSQQKNVEALTAANQRAFEGTWNMVTRQGEFLREMMEAATAAAQEVQTAASTGEMATQQGELMRQALERMLVTLREMSEAAAQAQIEALNAMTARMAESIDEIQSLTRGMRQQ